MEKFRWDAVVCILNSKTSYGNEVGTLYVAHGTIEDIRMFHYHYILIGGIYEGWPFRFS